MTGEPGGKRGVSGQLTLGCPSAKSHSFLITCLFFAAAHNIKNPSKIGDGTFHIGTVRTFIVITVSCCTIHGHQKIVLSSVFHISALISALLIPISSHSDNHLPLMLTLLRSFTTTHTHSPFSSFLSLWPARISHTAFTSRLHLTPPPPHSRPSIPCRLS